MEFILSVEHSVMESKDIKKMLAGVGIAGLLSGAAVALTAGQVGASG